jgi:Niemann-Pick C1 protein
MDSVDLADVNQQIDILALQRRVTKRQPIKAGTKELNADFFSFMSEYNMWEFYSICVDELIFSAIVGVISVSGVALLLLPHWSACPIVFPLMCILYVDMLGVMQWAGVSINAVSYVIMAMSIGLLVDFLMHVLLRYYELPGNRREKTIETLRTMGSSILLGGITTFLGTVPLAFSTSQIFFTVFIAFMALVTLGISHGLILLPVILATIGTEEQVSATHAIPTGAHDKPNRKETAESSIVCDQSP